MRKLAPDESSFFCRLCLNFPSGNYYPFKKHHSWTHHSYGTNVWMFMYSDSKSSLIRGVEGLCERHNDHVHGAPPAEASSLCRVLPARSHPWCLPPCWMDCTVHWSKSSCSLFLKWDRSQLRLMHAKTCSVQRLHAQRDAKGLCELRTWLLTFTFLYFLSATKCLEYALNFRASP